MIAAFPGRRAAAKGTARKIVPCADGILFSWLYPFSLCAAYLTNPDRKNIIAIEQPVIMSR